MATNTTSIDFTVANSTTVANTTDISSPEIPKDTSTTILPDTESHDNVQCTSGQSLGYMLVRQPNITSVAYVRNPYLIRWDYTQLVTKQPEFVDIYLQQVAAGVRVTWKNKIASNVTGQYYWWRPMNLLDGKYKVRIVPNGKETFNIKASEQPCFGDGEAVPSVSSTFKLFNVKTSDIDNAQNDVFSSSNMVSAMSTHMLMLYLVVLIVVLKHIT